MNDFFGVDRRPLKRIWADEHTSMAIPIDDAYAYTLLFDARGNALARTEQPKLTGLSARLPNDKRLVD